LGSPKRPKVSFTTSRRSRGTPTSSPRLHRAAAHGRA
jgi:hypothetical protein